MVNPEKQQSVDDQNLEGGDRADQNVNGEDAINASSNGAETSAGVNPSIARRLRDIFVEDGDGDLLLQRSENDDGVLQWFRAMDMQVMGACRADERLKPLLKLNVSTGMAEDRLLAHLSQHFEPSEVGMLARCLCIPLVSIRVGKINKKGTLLSPTSIRGNLCLTLLPTSELRISFNGDDGSTERVATFSTKTQCTAFEIEEITEDKSGRSFVIKILDSVVSCFWSSEKSKLCGDELLKNMKDLLVRKPSLAELTGISESRLNCFATHLRAYLAGSVVTSTQVSGALSAAPSSDDPVNSSECHFPQSSLSFQKIARFRHYGSQGSKTNLIYQSSLSPRSSSFKDGLPKTLSSIRSAAKEKFKRRGENYVPCVDNVGLASSCNTDSSSSNFMEKDKLSEANGSHSFSALSFLDVFGKSTEIPFSCPEIQVPYSGTSHVSPHYCWCPPVASALQYTLGNSHLPISSTESLSLPPLSSLLALQYTLGNSHLPISSTESLSLPPLSSLLSSARQSGLLTTKPSLNMAEVPPLDFPTFLPDPLLRVPTSQQIPTFTPLICDPIVHIPVIDVCSSGQGYLVSAGPAMSTTISPINPNLVDPLLPDAESMLEKGARETLRMLINGSNQPNPPLLDVLPSVLSCGDEKHNILVAGSRGLYNATRDMDVFTKNVTVGLVLLSEKTMGSVIGKRCTSRDDLIDQKEKPSSSGPSSFDDGID